MHYIFGNRRRIAIAVILGVGIVIALLGAVDRARKALSGQQRPVAVSQSQVMKEIRDLQKILKESTPFGEENHSVSIKLSQKGANYRGDLGGVTVEVPKSWAFLLSYDDAKNPKTQEHIINGFILRTNFEYLISGQGDRMKIGEFEDGTTIYVFSGSHYPDRHRKMKRLSSPCFTGLAEKKFHYKKSPSRLFDLEWCFPEQDLSDNLSYYYNNNYYYKMEADGEISDVMECFNGNTRLSYCYHHLYMPSSAAAIEVRYHKMHLKDWRRIKDRVQSIISDFYVLN
ncbi:hypothetical protein AAHN93_13700 [Vandammella animalimorsus]|uniref:hypothetical protein n=1 Tax=Vandammella animalimorsus TaxID=2029117 RepID=UPI0031BB06AE